MATGMKTALAVILLLPALAGVGACQPESRKADLSREALQRLCGPQAVDIRILVRQGQDLFVSDGAGAILHEDGFVLTAEHVTAAGVEQHLTLEDGTRYPFTVLARAGGDACYDLAVLRFKPDRALPAVTLGRSDAAAEGQEVMILGNPAGRRHTVHFGRIDKARCGGGAQFQVTGADVGPGDSGGPIFNLRGELIGHVSVAITTAARTSRNMRIDNTRDAFDNVFQDERRREFKTGLRVDCHADAARVTAVQPGSAADAAGLRPGDVVVKVGGMRIGHGIHCVLALLDVASAATIPVTVTRDGKPVEIPLSPRP